MNVVVPLLSSLVSLAFALAVLDQYLARRKPYQLIWSVGLFMYFIATGCEFLIGALDFNSVVYRLWYLFGAVFVAAYLGLGSVFLLAPRRVATVILIILLLASALAAYRTATAPVDPAPMVERLAAGETLSGDGFPTGLSGPRLLTPFFNTFGAVALVGGAAYSAWVFWRRRIMPHRVASNVLIALGAMLPLLGGVFARLGQPDFLYILELVGIVVIFLGFLRSRDVFGLYRFPFIHGLGRAPE